MTFDASQMANLRLWQLISPALPVGAYAYSGGLEYALHAEWLHDADAVEQWIRGLLQHNLSHLDVPVLQRCYLAWSHGDSEALTYWSEFIVAARESAELRAEDLHLGRALATLLTDLDMAEAAAYRLSDSAPFVCLLALAGVKWQVPIDQLASGLLWSWSENQVAAAIKLVPLGQTIGQKMLLRIAEDIPGAVATGLALEDDDIGALAPGLGIASALHETQYSRLFRS
ncbi:MAG: urease accessory protein UreF [Gammaproteobacteria bacterium]|nr:urease accessory protein UreF [Gammaproteobacteria bacterium]